MKQLVVLVGCGVFLSGLVGCQKPAQTTPPIGSVDPAPPRGGVEVIIEDDSEFPEFLVGRWKAEWQADRFNLEITFERGGKIASIVHSLGMLINIEEEGFYEEGPGGLYAYYVMGPCEAKYTASSRELNVKIIMDYFRMELPIGILEGKVFDYFDGVVSRDGKTWNVDWINYGEIVGADSWPDPNTVTPIPLVFTKVQDN